jgi:hypothetical protein
MAAIYSNGGNRWNILGFNFTKRDALSSVYKISMPSIETSKFYLCFSGGVFVTALRWHRPFEFNLIDHLHYRLNFDLNKSRQKFHHSWKEHHKISYIPKFRCEML